MRKAIVEECGTGRQWMSYSACAKSIGKTTEQLRTAMSKGDPVNGKYYAKINHGESICWRCCNTKEGVCDLFTKSKSVPPKGAKYETRMSVGGGGREYTGYLVTKCKNYKPELPVTIVG